MSAFEGFEAACAAGDTAGAYKELEKLMELCSKGGNTVVCMAIAEGGEGLTRRVLEVLEAEAGRERAVEEADRKQKYGEHAVGMAAKSGSVELMQLLVEIGADLTNRKALHEAVKAKKGGRTKGPGEPALDLVRYLVEEVGCAVDEQEPLNGYTPLHEAAHAGHDAVIEYLVERGAPVDAEDEFEETPIMMAAGEGHSSTVLLLRSLGADADACNQDGMSVAEIAEYYGDPVPELQADHTK